MNAPRYEIRTVRDFLMVPEDRIAECLREFRVMLDVARHGTALLDAVSDEVTGEPAAIRWRMGEMFTWVDDGLHRAELKIHAPASRARAGEDEP